jgi:hypothetical protein
MSLKYLQILVKYSDLKSCSVKTQTTEAKIGDTIFEESKALIGGFTNFSYNIFVVKENYYFCIGDSFSDAMDSRVFGLIPQNEILGKVINIKNVSVTDITTPH